MSELNQLNNSELRQLLNSNRLNDLYEFLDEGTVDALIAYGHRIAPKMRRKNKLLQAISLPLTDSSSYPLILLWSVIGVVTLGVLSLLISTSIMALLSLLMGGLFIYANYKELHRDELKNQKYCCLYALKNKTADLLLERNGLAVKTRRIPEYINKNRALLVRDAVNTTALICTTLFGTYFLGVNAVLTAFEAAAVAGLTIGPAGFLIGIGIAGFISLYLGYHYYQSIKADDYSKYQKKCLTTIVEKKAAVCEAIHNRDIELVSPNEIQSKGALGVNSVSTRSKFLFTLTAVKDNAFFKPEEEKKEPEKLPLPLTIGSYR
ncbi:hypothetical protein [Legionella taurinensis]|uniref:Uncharacterized protein n=1 Tax=Legionella taurinensis TaxID=70611 RepID=A0A3A5LF27_9GAMM|nr:hypothetical protein [Legionella taurinensis]RJT46955.1 hypothetical protein D6J04_07990 [Legionella taurinensis]RJT66844.1 hypothetical protein D6J03_09115 [Legionella taurinensis]STY25439.1 Uncharacterised protein [Legionella taurinensis]